MSVTSTLGSLLLRPVLYALGFWLVVQLFGMVGGLVLLLLVTAWEAHHWRSKARDERRLRLEAEVSSRFPNLPSDALLERQARENQPLIDRHRSAAEEAGLELAWIIDAVDRVLRDDPNVNRVRLASMMLADLEQRHDLELTPALDDYVEARLPGVIMDARRRWLQ